MLSPDFWPLWFRQLSVHQDYVWFLVLLGWGFALVFWWWHPARACGWRWVPWVAGACVAGAAVQFAIFSPPFDFFHDRLVPGTMANFRPALIAVDLLGDWLLGAGLAVLAGGWWWCLADGAARPAGRWFGLGAAGAAAVLHVRAPETGGAVLTALVAVAAWRTLRLTSGPGERLALLAAVAVPLFSTVGPVAAAAGLLQRAGPPGPLGLLAALTQTLAAGVALVALVPGVLGRRTGLGWGARWREGRWAALLALVWLAGGLGFAHLTGRDNRAELHQNRLRVAAARAALLDPGLLQLLDRPAPRLEALEWHGAGGIARVTGEPARVAREAARVLLRERRATPFIRGARLIVASDGWLFALAGSHSLPEPGMVEVLRRLTPADAADWAAARNLVEVSPVPEIGAPYYCRAAVRAPDGRMLGWLEFQQEEFFQSIERKWRSGPLLVTALGLLLGGTLLFQRRAEREREQAVRAAAVQAEASRVKSAFLASVSHELRTPLQSLLGYGELLRGRVGGDAQAEAWLAAMRQHGELMTRLVNDLIDLGAIEAGTFRLAPRVVAPAAVVRAVVEGLRVRAEAKGLALTCHAAESVPPAVRLDGERLRQIVSNLAGNAVKFTERGRVDVRLRAEPAGAAAVRLVLAVEDTGPGIAPEGRARLFVAFSRLEATAHQEGTGLGLALTAALARAMGGDVAVASDGVSGSIFTASVVAAPAAAEELPAPEAAAPDLAGCRVLVVDDNALIRDLFVALLQSAGATCSVAATAESALATARHGNIDVAILDLALPGLGGIELAPRLRQLLPRLRMVGASAHAGEREREAALAAGMDAFLTKPVGPAELLRAVAGSSRAGALPAATANAAAPAAGDWRRQLEAGFGAAVRPQRDKLAAAVAAGDWAAARAAAHHLANSAAAVGDAALMQACAEVVSAAERGEAGAVQAGWRQVQAGLARRLPGE